MSLHVSEGFLSLASGQSGFPALRRQEQSETGNAAAAAATGCGGGRSAAGLYRLITATASGLSLVKN